MQSLVQIQTEAQFNLDLHPLAANRIIVKSIASAFTYTLEKLHQEHRIQPTHNQVIVTQRSGHSS